MGERNKEACGQDAHIHLPGLLRDKGQSSNLGSQWEQEKHVLVFCTLVVSLLIPGIGPALGSHETVSNLMFTATGQLLSPSWLGHMQAPEQCDQDPDIMAGPHYVPAKKP